MGKISVVGLGIDYKDLSISGYEQIKNAEVVVARTKNAISYKSVSDIRKDIISLDEVYQKSRNFDTLNKNLATAVINLSKSGSVCYVVDGSAVEDRSVLQILKRKKDVFVISGISASSKCLERLSIVNTAISSISSYDIFKGVSVQFPLVIYAIDSLKMASEVKLFLSNLVGDDLDCYITSTAKTKKIKVYEIDRQKVYDYSTCVYVPEVNYLQKQRFTLEDLFEILKVLRSKNGCPWDREQTPKSIEQNVIEESYELVEAVESGDDDKIIEEVGDMLLQVAFYITFGEESLSYNRTDVISAICQKLISRHTHVFGSDKAVDGAQALANWNKNKQVEKGYNSTFDYIDAIPKNLPALLYSQKLCSRLEKSGCQLASLEDSIVKATKLLSNIAKSADKNSQCSEILFLVNDIVRKLGVDSETALYNKSNELLNKFKREEK